MDIERFFYIYWYEAKMSNIWDIRTQQPADVTESRCPIYGTSKFIFIFLVWVCFLHITSVTTFFCKCCQCKLPNLNILNPGVNMSTLTQYVWLSCLSWHVRHLGFWVSHRKRVYRKFCLFSNKRNDTTLINEIM